MQSLCRRPRWKPRGGDRPALGAAPVARLTAGGEAVPCAGAGPIRRDEAVALVRTLAVQRGGMAGGGGSYE